VAADQLVGIVKFAVAKRAHFLFERARRGAEAALQPFQIIEKTSAINLHKTFRGGLLPAFFGWSFQIKPAGGRPPLNDVARYKCFRKNVAIFHASIAFQGISAVV